MSVSIQAELAAMCRRVYDAGLSPAWSGNLSAHTEAGVAITPSGWSLHDITAEQIVQLRLTGEPLDAASGLKPSSEFPLHRAIYEANPDCRAVIHAHPPQATTLCVAGIPVEVSLLAEAILVLGSVKLVPYILPGSDALANAVVAGLTESPVVMMANHGVVATGRTLTQAFYHLELLESVAGIYITTQLLGKTQQLTMQQVKEVLDLQPVHAC